MRITSPALCGFSKPILRSAEMRSSANYIQHGNISVFTHSVMVAEYSVRLAERLGIRCDLKSLVRGALLHDFFLYDWHNMPEYAKKLGLHGFTHPLTAAKNAKKYFNVSKKEYNIILSHMWPLTFTRIPRSKEGWLVCAADKYCSLLETLGMAPYKS